MNTPLDLSKTLSDRIREATAVPNIRMPKLAPNPLVVAEHENRADAFYKRLGEMIADFDAELDSKHEVGIRLVNFGKSIVFHLHDIGYWNPSLIFFLGVTEDGNPVQLIQHVSQIGVLLMKLPRKDLSKPKKRFGFVMGN